MLRNISHIRQDYDWDCGLACVRMALRRALGPLTDMKFDSVCEHFGFGTNVWTIDLASILTYFKVNYMYYTETLGVDMSYQENTFYQDNFKVDELRVNHLFSCADALDLKVEKRSLSMDDICNNLDNGCIAITLVNSNLLHCKWCRQWDRYCQLRYLMYMFTNDCCKYDEDFAGHYIVVCGYNSEMKYFYYKDPSCHNELCCISFSEFERAWHCHGTDSDIVFVDVEESGSLL